MNVGYASPRDLMMQQQQQQQQQRQMQIPLQVHNHANNDVPLEVIKAKRREVEQKLEALLALRRNGNDTEGYGNEQGCTTNSTNSNLHQGDPNLDSTDWMAFANLMEPGTHINTNMNTSAPLGMPPLQPEVQPAQAPQMNNSNARLMSNDNFVLSDRLAEILPELEVNYEVPNEEDTNGLIQFFADGDAWLNSNKAALNQNQNQNMNMDINGPPSLTHNVSIVSNNSGSSSSGSLSSRSNTPPTNTNNNTTSNNRKKRSKNGNANGASKRKLGRPSAFPQKLYTMLTSVPVQDPHLSHIVGFTTDGAAFEIFDNEAFVEAILPKYFKMSSFSSFQRQLQLYNFKRVTKGGAYRHPLFHRDAPDNLAKMARKQSKPSTFVLSLSASK